MSTENKSVDKKTDRLVRYIIISVFAAIILTYGIGVAVRAAGFSKIEKAESLLKWQVQDLDDKLKEQYPEKYEILKKLPYQAEMNLDLNAKSAILVDVSNGNIIYEKNADEVIPPASMTKLFAMYVLDEEIAAGRFSYSDIIEIPRQAYACNMPPHSSLMFLGKGQVVTLEELVLGLSICSGNDAAYALAYTVSGSMESFVGKMNQVAVDLGLKNTHFVEASGYSEDNKTTAREMAAFCTVYLQKHPDSLKRFHSVREFTYPKEQNMAPGYRYKAQDWSYGLPETITMGITQKNTNPLLDKLEGCDGLKTGYIDESGYNLALTAMRNETRFLSITMKGEGRTTSEGQANRVKDGTALMEFAFSSFFDLYSSSFKNPYLVKLYGAKEKSVNLVPAYPVESVTVPFMAGDSLAECKDMVKIYLVYSEKMKGGVKAGEQYGNISIAVGDETFQVIPLVADRTVESAGFFTKLFDSILY